MTIIKSKSSGKIIYNSNDIIEADFSEIDGCADGKCKIPKNDKVKKVTKSKKLNSGDNNE